MEFDKRIKGAITQTIVKALLEDVGYKVVPLGIEEVVREVITLSKVEYKLLGLPDELRSLPDFLVTNKDMSKSFLLEVKYRKTWSDETLCELADTILGQAIAWKDYWLLIFLAEPVQWGDEKFRESPSNYCRIIRVYYRDKQLAYCRPSNNDKGDPIIEPWGGMKWEYNWKVNDIFEGLNQNATESTVRKACSFIKEYPQILDNSD